MGVGAVLEPLVVVSLLFGGVWVNRNRAYTVRKSLRTSRHGQVDEEGRPCSPSSSVASDDVLLDASQQSSLGSLSPSSQHAKWRRRELKLFGFKALVTTPNSRVFEDRAFSRVIRKFPFLIEAWYWALIYWVYQLGRAFTAVTLVEGTVDVARRHALQVIALEQRLHIFWEIPVQKWFLGHPVLLTWINRLYSFIHIPGTILFLVWLFWYTTTSNRTSASTIRPLSKEEDDSLQAISGLRVAGHEATPTGPALYEARRRTMAFCNLLAFIVFTLWPCMPPRLLSDPQYNGPDAKLAKSFGFVDTVHGNGGEASVWTQNKFCNQYAAMPSLHFGYSLLVGLTVMTIPLAQQHDISDGKSGSSTSTHVRRLSVAGAALHIRLPTARRLLCITLGFLYPFTILVAIVSTANHFILDAVAGAIVCCIAWNCNGFMLNLLPLEDWMLWCCRIHFPERGYISTPHVVAEEEEGYEGNEKIYFAA